MQASNAYAEMTQLCHGVITFTAAIVAAVANVLMIQVCLLMASRRVVSDVSDVSPTAFQHPLTGASVACMQASNAHSEAVYYSPFRRIIANVWSRSCIFHAVRGSRAWDRRQVD